MGLTLKINSISLKSFKNLGIVGTQLFPTTYIVGKNSEGKSAILESIIWTLFECDLFGSTMYPMPPDAITVSSTININVDGFHINCSRIYQVGKKTARHVVKHGIPLSKKQFVALCNPRYALSLTPANIKEVLVDNCPFKGADLEAYLGNYADDIKNFVHISSMSSFAEIVEALEERLKDATKEKKELDEKITLRSCEMDALKSTAHLVSKANVEYLNSMIVVKEDWIKQNVPKSNDLAGIVDMAKLFKDLIIVTTTSEFCKLLNNINVELFNEKGKPSYFLTYKDKDVRGLSNSESIMAGLEFCNALMEWNNYRLPVFIDNGEGIQNLDVSQFDNISQVIATLVCEENLAVWTEDKLVDIYSKTPMKRSFKELLPNVEILTSWEGIRPTLELI